MSCLFHAIHHVEIIAGDSSTVLVSEAINHIELATTKTGFRP